jgi:tellurite resistance-related uncharacterized protein
MKILNNVLKHSAALYSVTLLLLVLFASSCVVLIKAAFTQEPPAGAAAASWLVQLRRSPSPYQSCHEKTRLAARRNHKKISYRMMLRLSSSSFRRDRKSPFNFFFVPLSSADDSTGTGTSTSSSSSTKTFSSSSDFHTRSASSDENRTSMPQLPHNVVKYSQVPNNNHEKVEKVFTADTIPKGLLKQHSTKDGTWGVIRVLKGELEYVLEQSEETLEVKFHLTSDFRGVIEPKSLHHVSPLSPDVEFVVEFYRFPGTGPVDEKREGL